MSDSIAHDLYAVLESTRGTTPTASPAFAKIRNTTCGLAVAKDSFKSEEANSDRGVRDVRHGAINPSGPINFELSYGSFDTYLEAVLGGTWTSKATITGTTLAAVAADNTITDSGNGFVTAGFEVGDRVTVSGFTGDVANNATMILTAVAAGTLTFGGTDGDVIADDAAGESVTITTDADELKIGTTRRYFTILRHQTDQSVKPYHLFTGCEFDSFNLTVPTQGMVTGDFNVMGHNGLPYANLNSLTTPTLGVAGTTSPFDSFTGTITEGGSGLALATEISLAFTNSLATRNIIGSNLSIAPSIGQADITANLTAYFDDTTLMEKFLNETSSALIFTLVDPSSNQYTFNLPSIKYTGAPYETSAQGTIPQALPVQALYDTTQASALVITRLPVAS
ncbi:phage tail tube protein [Gammaproteobacteria bacterium]|nr:phage tail tube protein [Gammaproteobacteria bacterium]